VNDTEVVEKLKAIVKDPEAMERLKQTQKTAYETIEYIREAGRVNMDQLRRTVYTI